MGQWLKENWFKLAILTIILIIGVIISCYYLYYLPNIGFAKEDLELQDMCSKKADKYFTNYDLGYSHTYTVHYNHKLNKCFGLVEGYLNGKDISNYDVNLINLYDGNVYANWHSDIYQKSLDIGGYVTGKNCCKDQAEFRRLVKPYMEN